MCRHSHVRFGAHLFHLEPVSWRQELAQRAPRRLRLRTRLRDGGVF